MNWNSIEIVLHINILSIYIHERGIMFHFVSSEDMQNKQIEQTVLERDSDE